MSRAAGRPALRALGDRVGILPYYIDVAGKRRAAADGARESIIAALGIDASTEHAAAEALRAWRDRDAARLLAPVASGRAGRAHPVHVRVPPGVARGPLRYEIELVNEAGARRRFTGTLQSGGRGRRTAMVPRPLAAGYYTLSLRLGGPKGTSRLAAEQLLVLAPARCPQPREWLGRPRAFGVAANLYTVRSGRNWGAGDFTDLAQLATWAGRRGAAFLAVNPLHALLPGGASPYSPVSRLFRNPLYLDPTAVPEFRDSPEAQELVASAAYESSFVALRGAPRIDFAGVMALKGPVLDALHRRFTESGGNSRDGSRGRSYARFLEERGAPLLDFATYLALAGRHDADWTRWPAELRRPDGAGIREFRDARFTEIDRHCFVQFELDRQLAAAASAGQRAQLGLELFGDLAIGVTPQGSDTWAFPGLFVAGARIGAPPDEYSPHGQDWGLAPLNPLQLVEQRCRYWILLMRHALEHVGALRLDHVMGLFRQYWVPPGAGPDGGAYVRYPADHLLAVLALESARRDAVIVGEDLGTVPKGLPAVLERWGILSTRLLYFERERNGAFRPARRYSPRAVVSIGTHDHPPFASYWSGEDLDLRRRAGLIRDDRALAKARRERAGARAALRRRLARERVLPLDGPAVPPPSVDRLCAAVHTFLARAPAPLLSLALDDLLGETEPVNLPGVGPDAYPSWTRASSLPLEQFAGDAGIRDRWGDMGSRVARRR